MHSTTMCVCHIKREEERDLYEIVQSLEIGKGVKHGASLKQEIFSSSQNHRIDELVEAFRTKSTSALQQSKCKEPPCKHYQNINRVLVNKNFNYLQGNKIKINLIQKNLNTHELKGNILYKNNFANLTIQIFAHNLLCIL